MVVKSPKCKCGSIMVCVDDHYICSDYYENIKRGIQELEEQIQQDELG